MICWLEYMHHTGLLSQTEGSSPAPAASAALSIRQRTGANLGDARRRCTAAATAAGGRQSRNTLNLNGVGIHTTAAPAASAVLSERAGAGGRGSC